MTTNENRNPRLGNYLSAAAVAVSLVFVGLEVRNNTIAVRGATMQAISDTSSSDFSPVENQQLNMSLVGFVRNLENTYLQHREGLVPNAVFESYGWNDNISRTRYFEEFWTDNADAVVGPEFKHFFESQAQIGP